MLCTSRGHNCGLGLLTGCNTSGAWRLILLSPPQSIETVQVDGSRRSTLGDFFSRGQASGLGAFAGWFYWADEKGLWRSPQDQPKRKSFLQRAPLASLLIYHHLQQPSGR